MKMKQCPYKEDRKSSEKLFITGNLFRARRLLDFSKFPLRTLIQARTSIRETRVH